MTDHDPKRNQPKPDEPVLDTPFPKHRYYYIALKLFVLALAAAFAARYLFGWW